MIADPTGSSLKLPFYLLNGTIFSDYLIFGWLLLFLVGVFSLIVIIMIYLKTRLYSFFVMIEGVLLAVFIIVQMILLTESFLIQYIMLFLGIVLIGLGALQNQRKIVVDAEKKPQQPAPKSHHHKHRKHK
jgi:hypothetical protein